MSQDLRRITRPFGLAVGLQLLLAVAFAPAGWASDPSDGSGNQTSYSVTLAPRNTAIESIGGPFRLTGEARLEGEGDLIFADGFESGDLSGWIPGAELPPETVMFFDSQSCPQGWTRYQEDARFLVGVPAGGQMDGTLNPPLGDLFPPIHIHSVGGTFEIPFQSWHYHWWSVLSAAAVWTSYHADGTVATMIDWGNGLNNEGEGIYPFAASLDSHFETSVDPTHFHIASFNETTLGENLLVPYIKLLACVKTVNRSR